jgi:hypothetical protein
MIVKIFTCAIVTCAAYFFMSQVYADEVSDMSANDSDTATRLYGTLSGSICIEMKGFDC